MSSVQSLTSATGWLPDEYQAAKKLVFLNEVFSFFSLLKVFLYEDRTRKYDLKAHEKTPNTVILNALFSFSRSTA